MLQIFLLTNVQNILKNRQIDKILMIGIMLAFIVPSISKFRRKNEKTKNTDKKSTFNCTDDYTVE
jgi:hypothetical protein